MNPASIILEYIKTLIWPVLLVSAFVIYNDELLKMIEGREIEAFGVKVGKQIDDVSSNYKAELEALKAQIKNSTNNEAALKRIELIEKGLDRELSYVRTSTITQQSPFDPLDQIGTSRMDIQIFARLHQCIPQGHADVGPFASAFWRVSLALPVLLAWTLLERRARGDERLWRGFSLAPAA